MSHSREACSHGHPFLPENTYVYKGIRNGREYIHRYCRKCMKVVITNRQDRDRLRRLNIRLQKVEAWRRYISPADLAWAAGHFEGEGTITLMGTMDSHDGRVRPLACLCSTDRQIIAMFSAWWPSSASGKTPRKPTKNANLVYRWEINSAAKIRIFIDQILPHIKTDRCRRKFELVSSIADKMLASHRGKRKPRYPEELAEIRRLNRRGTAHLNEVSPA